jgi:L-serine deaminase
MSNEYRNPNPFDHIIDTMINKPIMMSSKYISMSKSLAENVHVI